MRGDDLQQAAMFSYLSPEQRVPQDHPLRLIRKMVDTVFEELSPRFDALYLTTGRSSIAPEKLLRALLLQVFYTVRSERLLMGELNYNLLFRWFVGLQMDDPVWDPTVFSKNRDRLLAGEVAQFLFDQILTQARAQRLLSNEHFTVDGTLIEAWASHKSFQRKDTPSGPGPEDSGNPSIDFHGETRTNQTHQSRTDPEAHLYKKGTGKESKLCYMGHVVMENRSGLVVRTCVTQAFGTAEREASVAMLAEMDLAAGVTVGEDKGYDTAEHVGALRELGITPHAAQNETNRRSAIDGRTTHHPGYAISQRKRKRVEEIFGWMKTVGVMRKTRHRGTERVGWVFTLTAAAYNLVRMKNLQMETG